MELDRKKLRDEETRYNVKLKGRVLLFDVTYNEAVGYIHDRQPASFYRATTALGYALQQCK